MTGSYLDAYMRYAVAAGRAPIYLTHRGHAEAGRHEEATDNSA